MPKYGDPEYDKAYKIRVFMQMFNGNLQIHRQPLLAEKMSLNISSVYNTNIKPDLTSYSSISIVHSNEEQTMLQCVMIYPYSKRLTPTGTELHCPTSNKISIACHSIKKQY